MEAKVGSDDMLVDMGADAIADALGLKRIIAFKTKKEEKSSFLSHLGLATDHPPGGAAAPRLGLGGGLAAQGGGFSTR